MKQWVDILQEDFLIETRIYGYISYDQSSRSSIHFWYDVLLPSVRTGAVGSQIWSSWQENVCVLFMSDTEMEHEINCLQL